MNNFETSIKRLEEIIRLLEDNKIDLEQAISLFEEGTVLCKKCDEELKKAELVVKKYNLESTTNND